MIDLPYKIILGSLSPRRKELLEGLDLTFTVRKVEIDESYPSDLSVEEIPVYLAEKKGKAQIPSLHNDELMITSDTLVICEGAVMGKPKNEREAKQMLRFLSGKTHQVITGVCLFTKRKQVSFSDSTEVTFAVLSDDQMDYYIRNYRPFDKAGSYGIQEWIGMTGIRGIQGSYYNVMGLPVEKLYRYLLDF